ncbi:MAG: hypothetical protein IJO72_05240 [Oscillospiraceae bacterium]|nr:hypothetical protein [Oscillospiraceae bacterium]MBQ9930163.1 hypothetical protein [Oscillospiraceae bacterium]
MARKAEVRYVNFYSAGSSAYKLDAMPMPRKQAAPMPKRRKSSKILLKVDPIACAGVFLAAVMLIMMAVGLYRLSSARNQVAQMESYVSRLEAENRALSEKYNSGIDREEIHQIATQMGMVPIEQAQHIVITVPVTEQVQEPTVWEAVYTFLVGLFA